MSSKAAKREQPKTKQRPKELDTPSGLEASVPLSAQASIHIGASTLSILVTDVSEEGTEPLEFLEQSLPIARDVFSNGTIKRETIERAVEILLGYLASLQEMGMGREQITRVVVTNILAEASNHDVVINRLAVATGLTVEILDDGEMTRLIYQKTRRKISQFRSLKKKTTLVIHVGPGNTRALLFKEGRIQDFESYRLGTHRTAEVIDDSFATGETELRLIRDQASSPASRMKHDLAPHASDPVEAIVFIGYEIQHVATSLIGKNQRCSLSALKKLCTQISELPSDQRAGSYHLDHHAAEALLPALQICLCIADTFKLKDFYIPDSLYERGLLYDLPFTASLSEEFEQEVIRSAKNLAKKYETHTRHGKTVANLCQLLFEATQSLHQLDKRDALFLQTAAFTHECGGFISPQMHHKHSEYLILHSEIFGLSERERTIVALVARYHRMSPPKLTHSLYQSLVDRDRLRVSKLAAILRVADALDRTHTGRVKSLSTKIERDRLLITLPQLDDVSSERLALENKANLFRDIFGLEVVLAQ